MTRRNLIFSSLIVAVVMAAAALAVASQLPPDALLPIHWNLAGQPDAFLGKWNALLIPALIPAGIAVLFPLIPVLEPRRENFARSRGLYHWAWVSLLLLGIAIQLAMVTAALRWPLSSVTLILGCVGIILVLVGNQFGKSRRDYIMGIRTPWTLANEDLWIRTHRLAGKLLVLVGLLLLVAAFLPVPLRVAALLLPSLIAIAVVLPAIYSYWLSRVEARR